MIVAMNLSYRISVVGHVWKYATPPNVLPDPVAVATTKLIVEHLQSIVPDAECRRSYMPMIEPAELDEIGKIVLVAMPFNRDAENYTQERRSYKNWHGYKPMEQRSAKEQQAIKDYYDNVVRERKVKVRAKYPARPFLKPAVEKILPKLPAIWKVKIKQYFR